MISTLLALSPFLLHGNELCIETAPSNEVEDLHSPLYTEINQAFEDLKQDNIQSAFEHFSLLFQNATANPTLFKVMDRIGALDACLIGLFICVDKLDLADEFYALFGKAVLEVIVHLDELFDDEDDQSALDEEDDPSHLKLILACSNMTLEELTDFINSGKNELFKTIMFQILKD